MQGGQQRNSVIPLPCDPPQCLQVLPNASYRTVEELEGNIQHFTAVSEFLAGGGSLEEMCVELLDGVGVDHLSALERFVSYGPCEKEGLQVRAALLHWIHAVWGTSCLGSPRRARPCHGSVCMRGDHAACSGV